jgi:hypothetical protein
MHPLQAAIDANLPASSRPPMTPDSLVHSQRYTDTLGWASQLHRYQQRKGKTVPYISHLIAVSALVWGERPWRGGSGSSAR